MFFLGHFLLCPRIFLAFFLSFFLGLLPAAYGEADEDEVLISMSGAPASSINC